MACNLLNTLYIHVFMIYYKEMACGKGYRFWIVMRSLNKTLFYISFELQEFQEEFYWDCFAGHIILTY